MLRVRVVGFALCVLLMALAPMGGARALDAWAFHGRVTTSDGTPLGGATVRNGGQVAVTDAEGRYRLGQLLPGAYTLRASKACFSAEQAQVTVLVPADTEVDFELTPVC